MVKLAVVSTDVVALVDVGDEVVVVGDTADVVVYFVTVAVDVENLGDSDRS